MGQKLLIVLLPLILVSGTFMIYRSYRSINSISVISGNRVQVEFFVMSKCPDASKCEMLFSKSLLKLSPIINFTLSFIASEPKLNDFQCMHGPKECVGNKQQLCIQNMYPQTVFIKYLQCQSKRIDLIPNNGQQCAKDTSSNINWSNVQSCVRSNKGNELFHKSLERTRSASATKSCTIHLNGKFWCMHDGSWSKCSEGHDERSFNKAVCSRYKGKNKVIECAGFA